MEGFCFLLMSVFYYGRDRELLEVSKYKREIILIVMGKEGCFNDLVGNFMVWRDYDNWDREEIDLGNF